MQEKIHPNYQKVTFICSCGHSFVTHSTIDKTEVHLDICSHCHPFFTGQQKIIDSAGRVDRFRRRYANTKGKKANQQTG